MGQVCCAQDDKSQKPAYVDADTSDGGWRVMVQTALDFENMDHVLNRWKQSEVLMLQVKFGQLRPAIPKSLDFRGNFLSQIVTGEELCSLFPSLRLGRDKILQFHSDSGNDRLEKQKSGILFNQMNMSTSQEIPLGIHIRNLTRAVTMGGFLSCSGFIDNVTCGSSTDDIVDFRDFCHGLAICSRGSRKEMLIFLFLLFADESIFPPGVNGDRYLGRHNSIPSKLASTKINKKKVKPNAMKNPNAVEDPDHDDGTENEPRVPSEFSVDTDVTTDTGSGSSSIAGAQSRSTTMSSGTKDSKTVVPSYRPGLSRDALDSLIRFCLLSRHLWSPNKASDSKASEGLVQACASVDSNDERGGKGPSRSSSRGSMGGLANIVESATSQASRLATSHTGLLMEAYQAVGSLAQQTEAMRWPLSLKAFLIMADASVQRAAASPSLANAPSSSFGSKATTTESSEVLLLSPDSLRNALAIFSVLPSTHEELTVIGSALSTDISSGFEYVYVLDGRWWNQWLRYVDASVVYAEQPAGLVQSLSARTRSQSTEVRSTSHFKPGPIDNSSLQNPQIPLLLLPRCKLQPLSVSKPVVATFVSLEHEGVGFDGSSLSAAYHHYVLLSPGAWAAVTQFYGGAMSNRSSLVESLHMSVPRSPVFVRKIDFGRPFLQAAAGSKELRDRPVAHAGVVDLYPLVVQVHWCTSFGVSTSKSTNRVLCCGCCLVDGDGCGGTDSGTVDANSRGSSPASAAAAAVTCSARGVGRTGASCCSTDDILTSILSMYGILDSMERNFGSSNAPQESDGADDDANSLRLSDFRLWLLCPMSDGSSSDHSGAKRGEDVDEADEGAIIASGKVFLPAFPCYNILHPKLQSQYWSLLGPVERSRPLSSLVQGTNPCRVMIESKDLRGQWPTETAFGPLLPHPKYVHPSQRSSRATTEEPSFKEGEKVIAADKHGVCLLAEVVSSSANTKDDSAELVRVRFQWMGSVWDEVLSADSTKIFQLKNELHSLKLSTFLARQLAARSVQNSLQEATSDGRSPSTNSNSNSSSNSTAEVGVRVGALVSGPGRSSSSEGSKSSDAFGINGDNGGFNDSSVSEGALGFLSDVGSTFASAFAFRGSSDSRDCDASRGTQLSRDGDDSPDSPSQSSRSSPSLLASVKHSRNSSVTPVNPNLGRPEAVKKMDSISETSVPRTLVNSNAIARRQNRLLKMMSGIHIAESDSKAANMAAAAGQQENPSKSLPTSTGKLIYSVTNDLFGWPGASTTITDSPKGTSATSAAASSASATSEDRIDSSRSPDAGGPVGHRRRGRGPEVPLPLGVCGLSNLGNTCYMNSALQCIVHTPLLQHYFLSGRFRRDLNRTNVLGTGGRLTDDFVELLSALWLPSTSGTHQRQHGLARYIAPSNFKKVLQKCKPQFAGHEQQDVQEFLSELLDSLHEDLNKFDRAKDTAMQKQKKMLEDVKKKAEQSGVVGGSSPAKNDKAGGSAAATVDDELAVLMGAKEVDWNNPVNSNGDLMTPRSAKVQNQGEIAWRNHLTRNKSVMVDLFQGQQCSEVTCQVCNHTSRTFDPFMSLSLPLPAQQQEINLTVVLLRRLPRLRFSAVDEAVGSSKLVEQFRRLQCPMRLRLSVPHLADVADVKRILCRTVDSFYRSHPHFTPDADIGAPALAPEHLTVAELSSPLVNGFFELQKFLEDRDAVMQLTEAASTTVSPHRSGQADPGNISYGYTLVASENAKDIPFIISIPGGRLSNRACRAPLTSADASESPGAAKGSVGYSDEREVADGDVTEGDIVCDIDPKFSSKPAHRWPATLSDIELGMRLDALDHRGQWYAGSVAELWKVSGKDLDSLRQQYTMTGKGSGGMPAEAGLHIRVHFDSFSSKWDEWFSGKDYATGRLAPIYTRSHRKLKVVDLIAVHRRPHKPQSSRSPTSAVDPSSSVETDAASDRNSIEMSPRNSHSSSAGDGEGGQGGQAYDLTGYPFMLQCESFRSLEHTYRHLVEQALRYASPEEYRSFVEALGAHHQQQRESQDATTWAGWPAEDLPFVIRITAMTNPLVQPTPAPAAAKVRSRQINETIASGADPSDLIVLLGKEHQRWEGTDFPRGRDRPLCNFFFSRLLITIDWKTGSASPESPSSSSSSTGTVISSTRLTSPVPTSVLHKQTRFSCLNHIDDDSFAQYLRQHMDDTRGRGGRGRSNGATLIECLSAFAGKEELLDDDSWYCEKCKKHSKGSVLTSLSRLPDVLILHIKRFGMNARFREKIRTKVTFPFTNLDMTPFTTEALQNAKRDESVSVQNMLDSEVGAPQSPTNMEPATLDCLYDLYAVANHIGSLSGGHYTAFVRCADVSAESIARIVSAASSSESEVGVPSSGDQSGGGEECDPRAAMEIAMSAVVDPGLDASQRTDNADPGAAGSHSGAGGVEAGRWFRFDDDIVVEVPPDNMDASIVTESAYVLFYRRRQLTPASIINLIA